MNPPRRLLEQNSGFAVTLNQGRTRGYQHGQLGWYPSIQVEGLGFQVRRQRLRNQPQAVLWREVALPFESVTRPFWDVFGVSLESSQTEPE